MQDKIRQVRDIAEDLGVSSQAIIDRCIAEEVPGVDSPRSRIRIGLEMTIRDWFHDRDSDEGGDSVVVFRG